ncbi:MAG: TrkA family potassium uptake protein [Acidobacteriota bacterium]|jgi:trk system potassium uptake protein TrkA|nr:TrkA family potassium uptake protein [Acidobacteriota bacterium]
MAQVAVIGLGRFGFHAASLFHEAGHEVLAIDIDPGRVQRIRDHSTQAVVLDAREVEPLGALSIPDFDAVILSLGTRVDASALVTLHLKDLGVRRLIVKATSADHARLLEKIGASEIVFPERDAAERLVRRLSDVNLIDFIPLGEDHSLRQVTAPRRFLGKSLVELRLRNRFGLQVVGIRHGEKATVRVNPGPETVLQEGDVLFVLGRDGDLDRLKEE